MFLMVKNATSRHKNMSEKTRLTTVVKGGKKVPKKNSAIIPYKDIANEIMKENFFNTKKIYIFKRELYNEFDDENVF